MMGRTFSLLPAFRRLLAIAPAGVALVAIAASGTTASTGCTTQQCAPGQTCFYSQLGYTGAGQCYPPGTPTQTFPADFLYRSGDELVWDTAPLEGPWTGYNGMETMTLFYPPAMTDALGPNGFPTSVLVWVSSSSNSTQSTPFVPAAGQLAETYYISSSAVQVFNATCANYAVRVEIRAFAPQTSTSDAGADAATTDAEVTDAEATDAEITDGAFTDGTYPVTGDGAVGP